MREENVTHAECNRLHFGNAAAVGCALRNALPEFWVAGARS